MITLQYAPTYLSERTKFLKHNANLFSKSTKALKLLSQNPRHPSLHLEKLSVLKIWTIRIDKGNRIFLTFLDKDTALLLDIGKHDKYCRM